MGLFGHRCAFFARRISTSVNAPLLWKAENDAVRTVQLLSWGRGASGQLGGGIEEIRLYPSLIATLHLPSSFNLSPIPGRLCLPSPENNANGVTEVGISCGLFHSSLLVDGKLWMWGKGDGGRLGFGHEYPSFLPTLNPNLDSVRSVALGGVHSVALTSLGQVFTWSLLYSLFTQISGSLEMW